MVSPKVESELIVGKVKSQVLVKSTRTTSVDLIIYSSDDSEARLTLYSSSNYTGSHEALGASTSSCELEPTLEKKSLKSDVELNVALLSCYVS